MIMIRLISLHLFTNKVTTMQRRMTGHSERYFKKKESFTAKVFVSKTKREVHFVIFVGLVEIRGEKVAY